MVGSVQLRRVSEGANPVTIWECAALAAAVYQDVSSVGAWKQIAHRGFGDKAGGFFGAAFRRDNDIIIAFRGTSDNQDIIDDASMVPFKTPAEAKTFGAQFIQTYTQKNAQEAQIIAGKLELAWKYKILERAKWLLFNERLNELPQGQAIELDKFLWEVGSQVLGYNFRLRAFVGHSLGGALAQAASENYSNGPFILKTITGERIVHKRIAIPAVAFNSPYMGTIRGMRRNGGPGILCVNAKLDPLSVATRLAGNESHAAFLEVIDVPGAAGSTPPAHFHGDLGAFQYWLGKALLHFHGMANLRDTLKNGVGKRRLTHYFPCTLGVDD